MKKTIAKHTLGLIGTVILWLILWGLSAYIVSSTTQQALTCLWIMLIVYILVSVIYWAVKTIWFTKDKD